MPELLTADTGRATGSRASNRLRREGRVPCVLYGLGREPLSLSVSWPELRRALVAGGVSSPLRLRVGGQEQLSIVREIQRHPVRRDIMHIDFLAVDPDQEVTLDVPLTLVGLEEGDDAADLAQALHNLSVTAKPAAIPAELTVDAGEVRRMGGFRVGDLHLPAGVSTDADPELLIIATGADVEIIDETLDVTPEAEEPAEEAAAEEAGEPEAEAAGGEEAGSVEASSDEG
jgi:large subunit ribosomal protein L25